LVPWEGKDRVDKRNAVEGGLSGKEAQSSLDVSRGGREREKNAKNVREGRETEIEEPAGPERKEQRMVQKKKEVVRVEDKKRTKMRTIKSGENALIMPRPWKSLRN